MQEISDMKIENARVEEQLKLTESKNQMKLAEQESTKTQIVSKTEAIKAKGISLISLAESELKINQDALTKLDEDVKLNQQNKQATLIANAETYIIELKDKLEKAKIINKENEETAKTRFLEVKASLENLKSDIKVAEDSGTDFAAIIDNLKKSTLKMLKLRALKQIIDDDVIIQEILTKARNVGTDLRTLVNELNSDSTSAAQESYKNTLKISIAETLGDEYVDMFETVETVETVEKYNPLVDVIDTIVPLSLDKLIDTVSSSQIDMKTVLGKLNVKIPTDINKVFSSYSLDKFVKIFVDGNLVEYLNNITNQYEEAKNLSAKLYTDMKILYKTMMINSGVPELMAEFPKYSGNALQFVKFLFPTEITNALKIPISGTEIDNLKKIKANLLHTE